MSFVKYLEDSNNTEYLKREVGEKATPNKKGNLTREKQTTNNVLNNTLYDIYSTELKTLNDYYELEAFKNLTEPEQLSILNHIMRIQSFAIRKAIENKVSIALPLLGRFKYNPVRRLAFDIYNKYKDINTISTIQILMKSIINDLKRSKVRNDRINRLSIRKDNVTLKLNESNNRDVIDERHNNI